MTDIHLVQLSMSLPRIIGFYGRIWPRRAAGTRDEKFLVKTALTEIMVGDAMLRPWRIQHRDHDGNVMVLGYSRSDADVIRDRIADALPELSNAFDRSSVFSKPVRPFRVGERLQLQSRVCATKQVHVSKEQRKEMDAWAADTRLREREGLAPREREEVYREYFANCIATGASVTRSTLSAMEWREFARKDDSGVPMKATSHPVVDVEAICEVTDPDTFRSLLFTGIGRSRAYGCGMVLVRAAA